VRETGGGGRPYGLSNLMEPPVRLLWTLFKVVIGLAVAIPLGLFAMTLVFGLIGTVVGLLAIAVRLAVFGLVGYGVYRVARFVFAPGSRSPKRVDTPAALPAADPYYAAAMRELDSELRR
jgi:hypothetical protein